MSTSTGMLMSTSTGNVNVNVDGHANVNNKKSRRTNPVGQVSLAERLDAAAAAAEILFEMRASGGGVALGSEEADMLTQLRVVCEDHLNVLARTVEGGGQG